MKRILTLALVAMLGFTAKAAIYIVGSAPFGGWDPNAGTEMTANGDGTYTYTSSELSGTIWFVFSDGLSSDWDTFNGQYRYGPTTGSDVTVELNTATTTQKQGNGNGSYKFKFTSGTAYTITFDVSKLQFTIAGSEGEDTGEHTYSVAGSPADLFGAEWDQTNTSTDMTKGSDGIYTWTSSAVALTGGSTVLFKVVEDHDWGNAWPSSNYEVAVESDGTYTLTVTFDPSTQNVSATLTAAGSDTPSTDGYYITGDTGLGLDGWSYAPATALTLDETTGYYTYSTTVSAGTYYFVFANGQGSDWDNFNSTYRVGPTSGNQTVSVGEWTATQVAGGDNGAYEVTLADGEVTISLDATNMQFKVEGASSSDDPTPSETTYYILGDTGLGLAGWNYAPTDELTLDETTGYYTYEATVEAGDYYFIFANGQGSDWDNFNSTYRVGPTTGDETVSLDTWTTTQLAGGDNGGYKVTLSAGTVTISFDAANMKFMVEGTAGGDDPDPVDPSDHVYSIAGNPTALFGAFWDETNTSTEMTYDATTGLYTWTATGVELEGGTNVDFKVVEDHSWSVAYPSENYSAAVSESGVYTVEITFNPETQEITCTLTKTGEASGDETEHTYSIAGNNSDVFGAEWDETNVSTEMTYDESTGLYTWTSSAVELSAGEQLKFKVVRDHTWEVAYPSSDYSYDVQDNGSYVVTITFNPETKEITVTVSPASGLSQVTSDKGQVTSVYDLVGHKLVKVQKGIQIVNGQKVLVR